MSAAARVGVRLGALVTRQRVLAYAAILLTIVSIEYIWSLATGPGLLDHFGQVKGTDFLEFYAAGALVAEGRGPELYRFVPPFRFPSQFAVEASIATQVADPNFAFVVPPFYALPFVALSRLPYLDA